MRLTKEQKAKLLQWVTEGLESGEINKRAAAHNPPFEVKRSLVDYYRKTHAATLAELKQAGEFDALRTGMAVRSNRVEALEEVQQQVLAEIRKGLYTTDVRGVNGDTIYIEKFNAPLVQQWRGLLDDIAREVGDRQTNVKHSGDAANPIEVVHIYIPENGRQ